jgi:hypothetical protein
MQRRLTRRRADWRRHVQQVRELGQLLEAALGEQARRLAGGR